MIVVDTNIIAYAYIRSDPEHSTSADHLTEIDPDWVAPAIWQHEFRNVLASYIRFQAMSPLQAVRLAVAAETHLLANTHATSSVEVLQLVQDSDCTAYDCEYVALARRLSVPCVTADRRLARAFPGTAVHLTDFLGH